MSTTQQDRLERLLEQLEGHKEAKQRTEDEVALAVYAAREGGASVRLLADKYDVPPSAIHTWTKRGESLRASGQRPRKQRRVAHGSPSAVLPVWLQWTILGYLAAMSAIHIFEAVEILG